MRGQKDNQARIQGKYVALTECFVFVDRNKLSEWNKITKQNTTVAKYIVDNATPRSFLNFLAELRGNSHFNKYNELKIADIKLTDEPLKSGPRVIITTVPLNEASTIAENLMFNSSRSSNRHKARSVTPETPEVDDHVKYDSKVVSDNQPRSVTPDSPTKEEIRPNKRNKTNTENYSLANELSIIEYMQQNESSAEDRANYDFSNVTDRETWIRKVIQEARNIVSNTISVGN